MSAELLADESVDSRIVRYLRAKGVEVKSVREDFRGSSDKHVLQVSREFGCIVVTEDSDFGEWIFAHQEQAVGVLFLRYHHEQIQQIMISITDFIEKRGDTLRGKFVTMTPKKVRIREI